MILTLREANMAAARSDLSAASTIFYVAAIVGAIYGLGFLLLPHVIFNLSQDPGVPTNAGWVRWAGGFVVGAAVVAWLAASNPESHKALVVGFGIAFTLVALALLYSTVAGEYHGAQWFTWLSILINAALAGAMWWLSTKYT
jgi:hypothetical protein